MPGLKPHNIAELMAFDGEILINWFAHTSTCDYLQKVIPIYNNEPLQLPLESTVYQSHDVNKYPRYYVYTFSYKQLVFKVQ